MTQVTGTGIKNVAGDIAATGTVTISTKPRMSGSGAYIDGRSKKSSIVAGAMTALEIEPGPVKIAVSVGSSYDTFDAVVPETGPVTLAALKEQTFVYEPPVVSQVQAYKTAAEAAAAEAADILEQVGEGAVPDAGVAAKVTDTSSQTRTALNSIYAPADLVDDVAAKASAREITTVPNSSVIVQGVAADYTGRIGTAGTGTDDRAAIQAALTAASSVSGSGYYAYLSRRSVTVKLPPGHYLIAAPASGPSLTIPAGVTLDASDAALFFDYPATATKDWCGIQVGQYGNLHAGKIATSRRNTAPDSADAYDGVRLVFTDNNSRVYGYKDSEIAGFQGAGIRGVGSWITYIRGIRFSGNRYGYVATNYGDAFTFPIPTDNPSGPTRRVHTDIYFQDCQFVNCAVAGFVGAALGTAASINGLDFTDSGLVANFKSCIFESIGGYALSLGNLLNGSLDDVSLEEVGSGDGMVNLNVVRSFNVDNLRVNFAGRSVTGPSGPVTPNPSCIYKMASVQAFNHGNFYVHNTFRSTFNFAEGSAPVGHSVGPGFWDGTYGLASGGVIPVTHKGANQVGSTWDKGHAQLGSNHLWTNNGVIRFKGEAPTSATDGAAIGSADLLATGQATMDRRMASSASINCPPGTLRLSYFTALRTETASNLRLFSGATAATGATLVRAGIYSVADNGDLTLQAAIASDTAVFATANGTYTRALTASYGLVAGRRYAIGMLVVGSSNTPNTWGVSIPTSAEAALPPRLAAILSSQTDLPSSITDASLTANASVAYAAYT